MTDREQAAEHLRVIRSLMQRATVYRAISWPTALFGGSLALALAVLLFFRERAAISGGGLEVDRMSEAAWVVCWLVALAVTGSFNAVLIARKAQREEGRFFSPGLKMALRALIPPMVAGAVVGIPMAILSTAAEAAAVWVVFYGLALLATAGFAPKSIPRLGWVCLVFGLAAFLYAHGGFDLPGLGPPARTESPMLEANLIMGSAFGVFHLVYALLVAARKTND